MSLHEHEHDQCDDIFPGDLIREILLRLPVKHLLRLSCVCRSWKSLIFSHEFAMDHLQQHSPHHPQLLSCTMGFALSNKITHCSLPSLLCDDELQPTEFVPLAIAKDMTGELFVIGSCNGLLCMSQNYEKFNTLTLFNPCNHSIYRTIPMENRFEYHRYHEYWDPFEYCYGFGYDTLHDKYKFVMCSNKPPTTDDKMKMTRCRARVCTFGTDPCWKSIDLPLFPYTVCLVKCNGTLVSETLNWTAYDPTKDDDEDHLFKHRYWFILMFELKTESFGRLCLPRNNYTNYYVGPHLQVLKNCLCVSFQPPYDETCCTLWILKEYGVEESWTVLFTIPYSNGIPQHIECLYVSEDDLVLAYEHHNQLHGKLFVYDSRKGKLFYPVLDNPFPWEGTQTYFEVYHQSLVSPSSFLFFPMSHVCVL
ncbi:hypothetical protein PIB30_003126 [Stylosanthes scabra]|uniref:F-box domain-containing protein n=1 Tax=Stylosanthes scabra TaxID=79078 RepID=A0ABU6Y006_9FABA|nr:hypothetical protein [Stylosanthes scabra]